MAAADQEPQVSAVCPRSYQDEVYLHGFLGTVGDLQKAGVLQDVFFEVEDRRFPCHRLVLSAASPYFRVMFTNDMAESRQKTVVLQGLDGGMFGEILSYIYSGTLHISLDKVQPLYQAADLLQLDAVRDTCSSYMAMNVERSTCVDLYKFADVFSEETVRKRCLQLIARHFTELASSKEFCSLSVNQLTEIISHDELDIKEETTVWEAVVRWVQHSREDRLHHLPSILPHICFNLLTPDDTAAILEHPLVTEDPRSSEVIRNVVQKGNSGLKSRLGITMEMALLCIGERGSNELLFMNPWEGNYIRCSYKPEDLYGSNAMTVTSDNNIYILDTGESEDNNQLSLFKYNHAKNVWEHAGVSSTSKYPGSESLLEVDQILYYIAVGGSIEKVRMKKYNSDTDQWQKCSRLEFDDIYNTCGESSALSCGSHIYVLTCREMHRYNPTEDKWYKCTQPMFIHEIYTAVAMGTDIFCTDMELSQLLMYDTEVDNWQKLQGLPHYQDSVGDLCPSLFILENQLHALLTSITEVHGEDDITEVHGEDEDISLIYVYDRFSDTWTDSKATLPKKRYYASGSHCPVARMHLQYLKGV